MANRATDQKRAKAGKSPRNLSHRVPLYSEAGGPVQSLNGSPRLLFYIILMVMESYLGVFEGRSDMTDYQHGAQWPPAPSPHPLCKLWLDTECFCVQTVCPPQPVSFSRRRCDPFIKCSFSFETQSVSSADVITV